MEPVESIRWYSTFWPSLHESEGAYAQYGTIVTVTFVPAGAYIDI